MNTKTYPKQKMFTSDETIAFCVFDFLMNVKITCFIISHFQVFFSVDTVWTKLSTTCVYPLCAKYNLNQIPTLSVFFSHLESL